MHVAKLCFIPRIIMVPKPTRSDFCAAVLRSLGHCWWLCGLMIGVAWAILAIAGTGNVRIKSVPTPPIHTRHVLQFS